MHITKRFAQVMLAPMFMALLIGCSGSSDSGTENETVTGVQKWGGDYDISLTYIDGSTKTGTMNVKADGAIFMEIAGAGIRNATGKVNESGALIVRTTNAVGNITNTLTGTIIGTSTSKSVKDGRWREAGSPAALPWSAACTGGC